MKINSKDFGTRIDATLKGNQKKEKPVQYDNKELVISDFRNTGMDLFLLYNDGDKSNGEFYVNAKF